MVAEIAPVVARVVEEKVSVPVAVMVVEVLRALLKDSIAMATV